MTLSPHLRHALSPLVPYLTTLALTNPSAGLCTGVTCLVLIGAARWTGNL